MFDDGNVAVIGAWQEAFLMKFAKCVSLLMESFHYCAKIVTTCFSIDARIEANHVLG